jgi:hypothetical protein
MEYSGPQRLDWAFQWKMFVKGGRINLIKFRDSFCLMIVQLVPLFLAPPDATVLFDEPLPDETGCAVTKMILTLIYHGISTVFHKEMFPLNYSEKLCFRLNAT